MKRDLFIVYTVLTVAACAAIVGFAVYDALKALSRVL